MLSENTVDYTIYACLQAKGARASLIEDLTRRLTSNGRQGARASLIEDLIRRLTSNDGRQGASGKSDT